MKIKRWLLTAAAVGLLGFPARAEDDLSKWELFRVANPNGKHELTLGLGAFRPTAKLGLNGVANDKGQRFGGLGYAFDMGYFYNLAGGLALGLGGTYAHRGPYEARNLIANAESKISGHSVLGMALIRLRGPGRRLRPYAVGGIGVHHTRLEMVGVPAAGYTWVLASGNNRSEEALVRGNSTGPAGTVRAGLEYLFVDGGLLAVEAGYLRIPSSSYQATNVGKANGITDIVTSGDGLTFSLRLGVRLGSGGGGS